MGTVTQLRPDGCEETAEVLVARIANPPSIDVSGVWQISHEITWGTGLLELSIGAEFDEEWEIYQHTDGMWEGILEITDSEGRQFLGTVNNNQVIREKLQVASRGRGPAHGPRRPDSIASATPLLGPTAGHTE